ncbi:MAG: hypothetical protein IT233_00645 [Bacteroidia bacterium]|nr:hypothetical protein [Bacteroidia bacterium]
MENETMTYRTSDVQPYTTEKLLKVKRLLEKAKEKNTPRYFEILVDGFKVVQRTNDLSDFDSHEEFVDDDTREVVVLLYSESATSPRNTKHIFRLKELKKEIPVTAPVQQGLSGVELQAKIDDVVEKKDMQNQIKELQKQLEDSQKKNTEADDYIDQLEDKVETLEKEVEEVKGKTGERWMKLAENPPLWIQQLVVGKVTGNVLSGTEEKKPEGDVSFTKKTDPVISEMQKRHLQVIQAMEQELNEDQLHTLMRINDTLITDKTKIPDVADLLDLNKE